MIFFLFSALIWYHTGVEIHNDTPTEILHTILLGVVKYFWGQTVFILARDKTFSTFRARLNSVMSDGLSIPKIPSDYIWLYRGSLIGKHFKTLSQIIAFTIYDLVPRDVLDAWTVLGRLTVLLWHTEIEDIDIYVVRLSPSFNDIFVASY